MLMKKAIKKFYYKVNNYVAKLKNEYIYKQGLISDIEYELRKEFLEKIEQFGTDNFYQNYPPLKISGKRDSLCRYKVYGLDRRLKDSDCILDIGGNIGFFSIFLSKFVKSVDIVERNKNLTDIGKKLLEYENITNVKFKNLDFKVYDSKKRYDLIMSLAIHRWAGLEIHEYLGKVRRLLKEGGSLLIESHIIYARGGDKMSSIFRENELFEVVEEGAIDDHEGQYREFFWLKPK